MKREFLSRPEPRSHALKRKQGVEDLKGAPAGLPQFLKRGSLSAGEQESQADRAADAAASGGEVTDSAGARQSHAAAAMPAADAGSTLDPGVRGRIEPVVGADLAHVRVHQADADRGTAAALGARAFTHGHHIWMGPGESPSDIRLMAHEAAHVVQQAAGPPSIQKQPQQPGSTTGTPAQMSAFVTNPSAQTDAGIKTALAMLNRYSPTVEISKVEFRVTTVAASFVGAGLMETASSHWEGAIPVIELTQEDYDTIAQHLAGAASVAEVHEVIRTVGHEMYHLYRDKTGDQSNPIKALYDAEAARRMEEIRQNWVKFAQDPGGAKALGIPSGKSVTKWEDIPAGERQKIETGATNTAAIKGLYEHTAYIVEETYVKIEEVSYLRVQQQAEAGPEHPSRASLSELARLLYRFNTELDNSVNADDFMTADLVTKTRTAMLDYLRRRYPHRADTSLDSFEVVFYLAAINYGRAPIYDSNGALISARPPGARVP